MATTVVTGTNTPNPVVTPVGTVPNYAVFRDHSSWTWPLGGLFALVLILGFLLIFFWGIGQSVNLGTCDKINLCVEQVHEEWAVARMERKIRHDEYQQRLAVDAKENEATRLQNAATTKAILEHQTQVVQSTIPAARFVGAPTSGGVAGGSTSIRYTGKGCPYRTPAGVIPGREGYGPGGALGCWRT